MTDADSDLQHLRRLSKSLLGSKYRAEIGAAIADSGKSSVWNDGLRKALGSQAPGKGQLSEELGRLEGAEILVRDETNPHDRRRLLKPADRSSAFWKLCQELRASATSA